MHVDVAMINAEISDQTLKVEDEEKSDGDRPGT
jgi:hypothetical protein